MVKIDFFIVYCNMEMMNKSRKFLIFFLLEALLFFYVVTYRKALLKLPVTPKDDWRCPV